MLNRILLVFSLFLLAFGLSAQEQQKIDSIFNLIKLEKTDSTKIALLIEMGSLYGSNQPDTALYFYNYALTIATNTNDKKNMILGLRYIGSIQIDQGNYPEASVSFKKSLQIAEDISDKKGMSKAYNNLGNIQFYQGDYPQAVNYYLLSMKIDEEVKDSLGIAACCNNIGCVYYEQGNYNKALEYFGKSMKIYELVKNKDVYGISRCYNGLGNVYASQGDTAKDHILKTTLFGKAIDYYSKSLKIKEDLDDKIGMSRSYNYIGFVLSLQKLYDKALIYFMKSLKVKEEVGDKAGIAIVLGNIAEIYNSTKQYNNAIIYAKKSLAVAIEIGSLDDEKQAYSYLYRAYKESGDLKNALENHEWLMKLNDSIFNDQKHQQLSSLEAQYQSEKKQKEIELLEKTKALQKTEIKRQTTQKYAMIIGFGLMFLLVILTLYSYKKIKSQNFLINEKNEELNQQNEEILTQRDEIESQNQYLADANRTIELKNKNITDSIHYAKRIQAAILPPKELIRKLIPNSFIIYKPKSIVSGDFFWLESKEQDVYIAAVDCTGHGVPGAFMSIVGYNILNQALNEKHIDKPAEILNFLSKSVVSTLRQSDSDSNIRDGMDLAICRIDKTNLMLEYAGANNPVYMVRNSELMVLKPDRLSIGQIINNTYPTYTSQSMELKPNDLIYLFSDGFVDQYNNENDKKFSSGRFKELLISISEKTLKEQELALNQCFDDWKGKSEQVDDMMVIGIRI